MMIVALKILFFLTALSLGCSAEDAAKNKASSAQSASPKRVATPVGVDQPESENSVVTASGAEIAFSPTFQIENPALYTNVSAVEASWTRIPNVKRYDVYLSPTQQCNIPLQPHPDYNDNSLTFEPLIDGVYYLCVQAVKSNAEGQWPDNHPYKFTVDTIPPIPGAILNSDAHGNNPLPLITWETGSEEDLYDLVISMTSTCEGEPVLSASDIEVTEYQLDQALPDGTYYLCLNYKDFAGNLAPATNNGAPINIDLTAPTALFLPAPFIGPLSTPGLNTSLVGTAADEFSGVSQVWASLSDGTSCLNSEKTAFSAVCPTWVLAAGTLDWIFVVPDNILVHGTNYTLSIKGLDFAGNEQTSLTSDAFTWDSVAPTLLFSAPAPSSYINAASVNATTLSGTCSENGIDVFFSGAAESTASCANGAFSLVYDFASVNDADISVTITQTDLGDNDSSQTLSLIKDTTLPVVNVGADVGTNAVPSIDAVSSDVHAMTYAWSKISGPGAVTFSGETSEDTNITTSMDGSYIIRLSVTDAAGNVGYDELSLIKDTVIPVVSVGPDIIANAQYLIEATVTDLNTQTLAWTQESGPGTITFGSDNAEDTTVIASADGVYVLRLTATDIAANSSFGEMSLTYDITKPSSVVTTSGTLGIDSTGGPNTDVIGTASDTTTGVASLSVSVQAGAGSCLNALKTAFDAACPEWHSAAGTTSWTLSLADTLFSDAVTYNISSRATDNAGNVQTSFGTGSFTWDGIPPDPTFLINADATYAVSTSVNLMISDVTKIAAYRIDNVADCSGVSWTDYTVNPIAFTLTTSQGAQTVCMQVKDAVGNISSTATDSIIYDNVLPASVVGTSGTLGIDSTGGANTDISGTASDATAGVLSMSVSVQAGAGSCLNALKTAFDATCPEWHSAAGTTSWTLSLADTLFSDAVTYNISSRATDNAGNVQTSFGTGSFTWDGIPPDPTFLINADATYAVSTSVNLMISDVTQIAAYRIDNVADCSGASWTGYTVNPIAFTLTASQGAQTVCLQVKDAVGNVSSTATESIIYDNVLPASVVSTSGTLGIDSTAGANTDLTGTASDATAGVLSMSVSVQAGAGTCLNALKTAFDAACPEWHSATGTTSWTLSLADTLFSDAVTYNISSRATDTAGNVQTSLGTGSFTWDETPPDPTFAIDAGAPYAVSTSVNLNISDVTQIAAYRVDNGADCSGASWTGYTVNPIAFTLTASQGAQTVCMQVKDAVGNVSSTATDSIIYDNVLPASVVSTSGTLGIDSTAGANTDITGTASDATSLVASMSVSVQAGAGSCLNALKTAFDAACPEWHSAAGTTSWTLSLADTLFSDAVTYNISARATDTAGNVQTSLGTGSFTWDETPPDPTFTIDAGAPYAVSTSVNLNISDVTQIAAYRVDNGADCSGASWTGYTVNPIAFTLTASQGAQTVCMQVKDAVGNVSSTATDSIIYDNVLPTSTITTSGTLGPETDTGLTSTLIGTASDATSGVASVSISIQEGTGNCLNAGQTAFDTACPVWHSVTGTTSWTIDINDSLFVDGTTYNLSSRATDTAGNVQTSFGNSSMTWDKTIDFLLIGQRNYRETYTNGVLPTNQVFNSPHYILENSAKIFVSDALNNRILIYESGLGSPPSIVLGQQDFASGMSNESLATPSAKTLYYPMQLATNGTILAVADSLNNRVLIWNSIPTSSYAAADVVVGQTDFISNSLQAVAGDTLYQPTGIAIIGSKLLVSDHGNHRVLIWNSIPTTDGEVADLVIGQGDLISGDSNRGGSPGANTLSEPNFISTNGTVLAIADGANNRVLFWNTVPTSLDVNADTVACQSDFTSAAASPTQSGCSYPYQPLIDGSAFYVTDTSYHRILYFSALPASGSVGAADGVFGQTNFTSVASNRGSTPANNSLSAPTSMAIIDTNFYVTDASNNRILKITTPPTAVGTETASAVYGQTDFSGSDGNGSGPSADGFNSVGCMDVNSTHLIIGDRFNGRVLVYDKTSMESGPIYVIGKNDFTSGCSTSYASCPSAANNNLSTVEGCALGSDGKIYISDRYRNRVLVYNAIPTADGQAADYVIGQDDFTTSTANTGTDGYGKISNPEGIEVTATQLFIADKGNNRILVYDLPIGQNRPLATVVIGQPDETTFTTGLAADKLNNIMGVTVADSKLITVEYANNRVMVFNTIPTADGASADIVLGQPDFVTANGATISQNTFGGSIQVTGVMVMDSVLYLPDSGNNRLLNFDWTSLITNDNAISVVGQSDYTLSTAKPGSDNGYRFENLIAPTAIAEDGEFVWIAEMSGSRVSRIKKALFLEMVNSP